MTQVNGYFEGQLDGPSLRKSQICRAGVWLMENQRVQERWSSLPLTSEIAHKIPYMVAGATVGSAVVSKREPGTSLRASSPVNLLFSAVTCIYISKEQKLSRDSRVFDSGQGISAALGTCPNIRKRNTVILSI